MLARLSASRASLAVLGAAVLVTGLLWWGGQYQVTDAAPHNRASVMVPPDGYRVVGTGEDGAAYVDEDARLTGTEAFGTAPPLVGGAIATRHKDATEWSVWRTVETAYDADPDADAGVTEQATTLTRISDRGLERVAGYGPLTVVFEPALLELPADVHDGSTWSSQGAASATLPLTYTDQRTAQATDHGCYRVTGKTVFSLQGETFPQPVDDTYCPGRGVVSDHGSDPPRFDGSTEPLAAATTTAADARGWTARHGHLEVAEAVAGAARTGGPAGVDVERSPVLLPRGGVAVESSTTRDVWGLVRYGDDVVRAWVGHPGGAPVEVGASGQVTVVGTTRRDASGYGDHGQFLWRHLLPDVMGAPLVAADAGHLILTTVAGDVVAVDPRSGRELWHHTMSDQVDVAPAVADGSVTVADTAGQIRGFDVETGDQTWSTELPDPAEALGHAGDHLIVLASGVVEGLAASDGQRQWTAAYDEDNGGEQAVLALGDDPDATVAVSSGGGTIGLDPDTGHRRWASPKATTAVAVGEVLVQVDAHRMTARDADGDLLGEWSTAALRGDTVYLLATATGALAIDAIGDTLEVGR